MTWAPSRDKNLKLATDNTWKEDSHQNYGNCQSQKKQRYNQKGFVQSLPPYSSSNSSF